jgi:hypothetical protein
MGRRAKPSGVWPWSYARTFGRHDSPRRIPLDRSQGQGVVDLTSFRFSNGSSIDDTGLGLLGGIGYDIPLGRKFSITPVATYQYGIMGDANGLKNLKQNIIPVGGNFTLH